MNILGVQNITEIKIFKVPSARPSGLIEEEVNSILKSGWVLLDISTMAPDEIPGEYGRVNYMVYHFGKLKQKEI